MKIIDLTHTITEDMPVYPGTEKPKLQIANTYATDGFKETLLTFYSHTGTHMDAPAHLFPDRTTLDQFPVSHFIGTAVLIDCTMLKEGQQITLAQIQPVKQLADSADFLIFHTDWSRYWREPKYFGDYPYIDTEVAHYLVSHQKKGVGLDTIGIDPIHAFDLPIHKLLLQENDLVIIENLTRLEEIGSGLFTFQALPLKFQNADGAPVRAVALCDADL